MFLSLQPRFFEKIFWRLKKGKKVTSIKEYFVILQPLFKIKNLLIIKKDYLQSLAIGVNFAIPKRLICSLKILKRN